jgi:hypothetical protein
MINSVIWGVCGFLSLLIAGCASAPDVTITYYLPKVATDFSITETVTCSGENEPIIVSTVAMAPAYSRDEKKPKQVRLSNLDGPFSDVDATFNLSPDGRLTGINSTQTGQGTTIVKSLVTLGSSIASTLRAANVRPVPPNAVAAACQKVKDLGKDKGVTLSFFLRETFPGDSVSEQIGPTPDSITLSKLVQPLLGTLCLRGAGSSALPVNVTYNGSPTAVVMLPVVQPALYHLSVSRLAPTVDQATDSCATPEAGLEMWSGDQAVPQRGAEYAVPIPKASLFGTQTIVLALHDSGAVTSLRYGKNNGLSGFADAATAVASQLKTETPADKASEVKGEADLIAQQQRLARCRANPANCT